MSNLNQHADRGPGGKLLRSKFRCHCGPRFPSGTPKWWRKLFMTRPRRHANVACCARIAKGADPDAMAFPLGNHKPHGPTCLYWHRQRAWRFSRRRKPWSAFSSVARMARSGIRDTSV